MLHHAPLDTPVAGACGNPGAAGFTSYGCPVFSAGEAYVTETMLIETQPAVLSWMQEVALQGEAYKNEVVDIFGEEDSGITTEEPYPTWGPPETDVPEEDEAKDKTVDTKARDNAVKGDGGETQISQKPDKTDSNKAMANDEAVGAKKDDKIDAQKVETTNSIPVLPPASDGPEATDMKDLVEEIQNFTIDD
jgi:hypothetical protein